jgi:mitogen-activated protein kinase 1/3
MPESSIGKGS